MSSTSGTITSILDELDELAASESEVSVGDMMEKIGHRGTGVFLLVPGLLGVSPLGAIPTVPTLLAAIATLFAVQIAIGRQALWLPAVLRRRAVDDDRVNKATGAMRGVARWLDAWFGNRLTALTGDAGKRATALICIALAATVPILELVPFAAAIPLAAIAALGLALVLRDGLVMVVAWAGAVAALASAIVFLI